MLNNNFTFIGTVVSGYEDVPSNPDFPKKKFSLEVARKGKTKSSTYEIVVFDKNRTFDTSVNLVGKVVIVNGYIDIYKNYVSLVAQDVYIVGVGKPKIKDLSIKPNEEVEAIQDIQESNTQDLDMSDENLPF